MADDKILEVDEILVLPNKLASPYFIDQDGVRYPRRYIIYFDSAVITDDEENDTTIINFDVILNI